MSTGETSKQKTSRILPDYYRRPDRLQRVKRKLAWAALCLAVVYGAGSAFWPKAYYSPGPLAVAHATWDDQCQACHTSFRPIREDAAWGTPAAAALSAEKCGSCHRGPDHHANQKRGEVAGCASCHVDHQGRDASLLSISDRNCTRCHDALSLHAVPSPDATQPGKPIESDPRWSAEHVTQFDAEHHPQFRSARTDPGKLKFSHWRHLAPGLNLGAGDRLPPKKWTDLDPSDRERYPRLGIVDGGLVQLTCAACHQQDAGQLAPAVNSNRPATVAPQRAAGAIMLPVRYEQHCRACHALPFDPEPPPGPAHPATVPHGLKAAQLREFLEKGFAQRYLSMEPKLLGKQVPLGGQSLPNQLDPADRQAGRDWIAEKVAGVDRQLRGTCTKCHELPGRPTDAEVTPTNVPQVWLPHARFDHTAHRAADCKVCHEGAYAHGPPSADASGALDNDNVLIPQLAVCAQCHAPRRADGSGGARFDCVECHRYHNGDKPLEGPGAPSRGANQPGTLKDFFNRANWPGASSGGLEK